MAKLYQKSYIVLMEHKQKHLQLLHANEVSDFRRD
jgi:hypothetical protein